MKVRIRARQMMSYNQIVDMTEKEFRELIETPDDIMRCEHRSPLDGLLDLRDCDTDGGFEDYEIEKVSKSPKRKATND